MSGEAPRLNLPLRDKYLTRRSRIMNGRAKRLEPDRFSSFSTDEARWRAVERRDAGADGRFWYSVATTGVYCMPSCGARLPRRENVRFHASTAEAERAGFRPCKRCRPNDASLAERQLSPTPAVRSNVPTRCRGLPPSPRLPAWGVSTFIASSRLVPG